MTVETGSSIADLDPNAPADSEPLGESNEHIQRTKLSMTYTFAGSAGDRYDETSGPVSVGPIALNRLPADVSAIATEIGLNLDATGNPTIIDDLVANTLRRDQPENITQNWSFTGNVDFSTGAVTFTGIVPTIDGVAVATVNEIPTYLERSRLEVVPVSGATYNVAASDIGKKINFTGTGNATVAVGTEGIDTDLLFVTNANTAGTPESHVLTITMVGGFFLLPDGRAETSISITGRYRTIGLHKVASSWQVTGDVD